MKTHRKESLNPGYQNELLETYNVNLACFMTQHEFLNSQYLVTLAKKRTCHSADSNKRVPFPQNVNIKIKIENPL